jgi:hypothetical protein
MKNQEVPSEGPDSLETLKTSLKAKDVVFDVDENSVTVHYGKRPEEAMYLGILQTVGSILPWAKIIFRFPDGSAGGMDFEPQVTLIRASLPSTSLTWTPEKDHCGQVLALLNGEDQKESSISAVLPQASPESSETDVVSLYYLKRLNVNPKDIQVGARFWILTHYLSMYVLVVNESGEFEIEDIPENHWNRYMIGITFTHFDELGQLRNSRGTRRTSPVMTMVKVES